MSLDVQQYADRQDHLQGYVPVAGVIAVGPDSDLEACHRGLRVAGVPRWVEVRGAESIAEAYNAGTDAAGDVGAVLYIHDDAELLVPAGALYAALTTQALGGALLGAIGARQRSCLPWWSRAQEIIGGATQLPHRPAVGAEPVGLLDGVVLLQARPWQWDHRPGWHGYDANRCLEAHERGVPVMVHDSLACAHHTRGYKGRDYHLAHAKACVELAERWGLECRIGGAELFAS